MDNKHQKKSLACSVGGLTATDLNKLQLVHALKPYDKRERYRVFPQDPRQTGRCWHGRMAYFQWQSHISLQHLLPVTTVVSDPQNRDHVMDSEPDFRNFDAFCVISCHKTCRSFFFLQRNPSLETLAGLCIVMKIPLISPSSKRSRVHPNNTLSQRQTRCGFEYHLVRLAHQITASSRDSFLLGCAKHNKYLSTATQAHWSNGITIRNISLVYISRVSARVKRRVRKSMFNP